MLVALNLWILIIPGNWLVMTFVVKDYYKTPDSSQVDASLITLNGYNHVYYW